MSAVALKSSQIPVSPEEAEALSIIILYDNVSERELAFHVCDRLTEHFGTEINLSFCWWRTDFLNDPALAAKALEDAEAAEIVIVALSFERELPAPLRNWFERWLDLQPARERLLVDLTRSNPGLPQTANQLHHFLYPFAHRAKADYLASNPHKSHKIVPLQVDLGEESEWQVTTSPELWSEQIIPPSDYGLNE